MREIVLDTETTGLDPMAGHRIIEIGAVELVNHVPTARMFHKYLNPDMAIEAEATAVHGITNEQLKDKPRFDEVVEELIEFLGDARLIIHNADFDVGFLNAEFVRIGFPTLPSTRATCTVKLRDANIRDRRPASTRCAAASRSIIPRAPCTARCSTRSFWPNAISK